MAPARLCRLQIGAARSCRPVPVGQGEGESQVEEVGADGVESRSWEPDTFQPGGIRL